MNLLKHFPKWYLALAIALALICLPVIAQSSMEAKVKFYIKSRSTANPLTVGDRLTLRLEVIHSVNSRVALPQVDKEWGGFHVIEQTAPETVNNSNDTATTSKNIIVTAFRPGLYKTPDLIITHRKPNGDMEDLAAPIIQLKISTVLTDEDDIDLHDLKPQVSLLTPLIWAWVLGGLLLTVLLVMLIGWVGWWWQRRQRKKIGLAEAVPMKAKDGRPADLIAYTELDWIESLNLPIKNQIKEHYSLVADCVRRYVENRYEIAALEQTSGEIHYHMKQHSLPPHHVGEFMSLLSESDLVKFARYLPENGRVSSLVHQARDMVALTTPTAVPALTNEENSSMEAKA